jgi:high-affinity iron transporter
MSIGRFGLRTTPAERPSLERAQRLYGEGCAPCHGARGDANTDRARELDPHPASFRDPERLGGLAPYRVYNALTFGVPGTAMASFDSLSPSDRWSLAFYVFRLGHEGEAARPPVAMPLADLAIRTDRELTDALRAMGHPDPAGGLVHARREAAFQEPPAGVGIDATQRLLHQALRSARAGDFRAADRQALDAYLQGFEPLEPRLRVRDPQGTQAVEDTFGRLRAAIARGDAAAARQHGDVLEEQLSRLGGGGASRPALAAFVIYVREGVEAALLVAALLAGLRRLGRADARRYIHVGWLTALPAGVLTWWLAERVIRTGADQRELVEAGVGLLAAAVLFSVSFWMISKAESRHWMGYLRRQLETTLSRQRLALLAGLSFLAVYREAAETVLFTQALLLESAGRHAEVWLGALAGLLVVAALGAALGRSVMKLPLGPFFAVSGILLCVLSMSFAGTGIHELVAGGYLEPRPVRFPTVPWLGVHPEPFFVFTETAGRAPGPQRPAGAARDRVRDRPVGRGRAAAPRRLHRVAGAGRGEGGRRRTHGVTAARVLTLLSAPGCHLCHDMRAVVERLAPALGFTLQERNVRESDEWRAYRLDIPVLLAEGREVARHRVDEAELERRLRALSAPQAP